MHKVSEKAASLTLNFIAERLKKKTHIYEIHFGLERLIEKEKCKRLRL